MAVARGRISRRRSTRSAAGLTRTSAASWRRPTWLGARTSRRAATSSTTSGRSSYRTNDYGATWTSIAGNLPNQPINVIYEDPRNPDLLFVGNDTGVFVTIDQGAHWVKMNNNIPNVPIHDLLVHPREHDLVLGLVRPRHLHHATSARSRN